MSDRQLKEVDGSSRPLSDSLEPTYLVRCAMLLRVRFVLMTCGVFLCFFIFVACAVPHRGGEERGVVQYSSMYFLCCFIGGVLSGLPHTLMTPMDLVKCRMQVGEYESMTEGFRMIYQDAGGFFVGSFPLFFRGWVPTFIGYSLQGGIKFFFYEVFKFMLLERRKAEAALNSPMDTTSYASKLMAYLAASFFAEVIADVALAPWEAVKIKIQTTSVHRTQISVIVPMVWAAEGCNGFYKGLTALWCRQVPYTVVKFMSFESIAQQLYKIFLSNPGSASPKSVQLLVSLLAGIMAGMLCALVSHPADTIVSKLNQRADTSHATSKNTLCYIVRELGWRGLWRGIVPRLMMVGALTAIQWVLYDSFKVFVGLPTTGGRSVAAAKVANHS
ncbi:putative mitochondrial carrier protein [Trypanosoma grayi]|uniref:putative mitochondrial carrier protein n=1 Tax=Trypanosoma grayi TaxID=71804 RepID=UPI0004F430AE|nr:putative mitochondrial carrier protein [Trypanosoma grayi]KEG14006.1 putative mitochondrial carrier protein [Trypanosoma grayi]